MLYNTFVHIPGIGETTERRLWQAGILNWQLFREPYPDFLSSRQIGLIKERLADLDRQSTWPKLIEGLRQLPNSQRWRLYPSCRDSVAFLDIETTGLCRQHSIITTIAVYDGKQTFTYVRGKNLDDFAADIGRYRLLVTYNGQGFDLPMIEHDLGIKLTRLHIDLRPLLKSLGFSGGLKGCERQLGLDRGELAGVDGAAAVRLWHHYQQTGEQRVLDTLLAYNLEDAVNLERLLVIAYNLKLQDTPFAESHRLALPSPPARTFQADLGLIRRLRLDAGWA